MLLESFAEITQRVIRKDGFEGFLPTLCLPESKHLIVLEGLPEEDLPQIRSIALEWAKRKAGEDEFLVAFREDSSSFRIIRNFRREISEQVFQIS